MFFNLFILAGAGFVFGWDRAMYSLIAYFIAYKVIDVVVEGIDESRAVTIMSDKAQDGLKSRHGIFPDAIDDPAGGTYFLSVSYHALDTS